MDSNLWMELISLASRELYFLIAFLCGLYIGYMIGFRNGSGQ